MVTEAFRDILDQGRQPQRLQSDKGGEFKNATFQNLLRQENIEFFTTENEDIKACLVERFNATLQNRMHRHFTSKHTRHYLEILPALVAAYNATYHRSIGMAPMDVDERNSEKVWQRLYAPRPTDWQKWSSKLKVDQYVRISKARRTFRKGYLPSWSREIFTVAKVNKTIPVTYRLNDTSGELIRGSFYAPELQRVQPPDLYEIEAVLDQRKRRGKTEYLVKWLGYPTSFNSWESDLVRLV